MTRPNTPESSGNRSLSPNTPPSPTPPPTHPPARLVLADGSIFRGEAFGATGQNLATVAEVVFNTAMLGYQESLTDPSYTGQILVDTFPLIGNTGTNEEDMESVKVQASGFVIRELARHSSNFRATHTLSEFLRRSGVLGITGVDTRAITRRLRTTGSMPGVITDRTDLSDADLLEMARNAPSMAGQNLVPKVGCTSGQTWSQTLGSWSPVYQSSEHQSSEHQSPEHQPAAPHTTDTPKPLRVLALDCGAKANILRNLADRRCHVRVVPHDTSAQEILRMHRDHEIDGLFISNGPGDPAAVEATINTLRTIINTNTPRPLPIFGICLGHQLLALAAGAETYKLKFGHRGANQPVLNHATGRVEITSQNHGFAVTPESITSCGGQITHLHLNDNTVAGFRLKDRPVFSVQYHPEASPGPHDASYLFDDFIQAMQNQAPAPQSVSVR